MVWIRIPIEEIVALGLCVRSQSFPDRSFMNEQESNGGPPGFGRCSSMIMERDEKRTAQHSDIWVPSAEEYLHISNLKGKQPSSQDGSRTPDEEVMLASNPERPVDMSLFQRGDAEPCIDYAEEKQLFPGSFKICDLNLMEASEVNENPDPDPDPILIFQSIPESKKDETPVDVDLSISNSCNMSVKYGKHGADGKEVEVIDLENDSVQEDKAFITSERKYVSIIMFFLC